MASGTERTGFPWAVSLVWSREQREAGDCLEVLAVESYEWNAGGDAASGNPGVVRRDWAAHGLTIGDQPSPDPWDRGVVGQNRPGRQPRFEVPDAAWSPPCFEGSLEHFGDGYKGDGGRARPQSRQMVERNGSALQPRGNIGVENDDLHNCPGYTAGSALLDA